MRRDIGRRNVQRKAKDLTLSKITTRATAGERRNLMDLGARKSKNKMEWCIGSTLTRARSFTIATSVTVGLYLTGGRHTRNALNEVNKKMALRGMQLDLI